MSRALFLVAVAALACQGEASAPSAVAQGNDIETDGAAPPPDVPVTPGPGADLNAPGDVPAGTGCAADPGAFGCPCSVDEDCAAGRCVDVEGGRICSQDCVSECPSGFACVGVVSGSQDLTYLCLPRFVKLCQPCEEHLDCQSKGDVGLAVCLDYGDVGSFCGAACGDSPCPAGHTCTDVVLGDGTPTKQCRRDDGECACSALGKALGMTTTCRSSNGHGTCAGSRTCAADGLSVCSAPLPAAETCDQADNDCDKLVDNLAVNAPCAVENEFGSCPGSETCVGGLAVCVGAPPAPDLCDGVDNDCNG